MAILITMPLKVTLVLVLFLMCFPEQDEARTIPLGQNQNRMNNHKDKLFGFGAVQKGEAPPNVPNIPTTTTGDIPSSLMIRQNNLFQLFVTNHHDHINVSPSQHRLLRAAPKPSCPNPGTYIPSSMNHRASPLLSSNQKSTPSSSIPQVYTKFFKHLTMFQLLFRMCILSHFSLYVLRS